MLLHDFSIRSAFTQPKLRQPARLHALAYSDDGYRRKQGAASPGQHNARQRITCKPRANCLKPKEIHAVTSPSVLTCGRSGII
jgi:hypothetical protein